MGQAQSSPIDESTPPHTLSARTVEAVGAYIRSGRARRIVVMSGAGISTSAGIPDFRSPDTGLYANLARLDLPYAEAVFDLGYFREHPEPFYALAHELYPGRFRPTVAHSFIRLLHDKGLLLMHFTQNIDCLDLAAGVPADLVVEAHGSFARQSCIECRAAYPRDELAQHLRAKTIPRCETCCGLVKPDIVFFGEQLPANFIQHRTLPSQADLCIVMGTSLTVHPFASLPWNVPVLTPRVLINKERVGGLGSGADDVLLLGGCDEGARRLAEACGWRDELEELWQQTRTTSPGESAHGDRCANPTDADAISSHGGKFQDKDTALDDEITRLTHEVDRTLQLSRKHEEDIGNCQ